MTMPSLRYLLLLSLGLGLIGCSGPRTASTGDADPSDAGLPDNLAPYEEFDASAFEEEPPVTDVEVEHDVPDRLMTGHAGGQGTRVVQGFRVQIFSSQDREAANEQLTEALAWWSALQERLDPWPSGLPRELPVYIVYKQPYYRLRVGNFTSREDASRFMAYLSERFPEAFVVPDEVTVSR